MQSLSADEIARLSPEERLALISQLRDSLQEGDVPLPTAQQTELARRLSCLVQDEDQAVDWEELRCELAKLCPP